ncbi:SGNH/GDSL hydrolase family protein [Aspergillus undulatus]|uniref:SGNH/GDSL hydrolase family protein n=1 Tax=Aspergillus undulatus TaxID=1810928 RepID=UPI003CCDDF8D
MAALAYPLLPTYNVTGDSMDSTKLKRRADDTLLFRVLPLGASITYGTASSHGNGYRKALRDLMTSAGHEVNMIGSRHGGTMKDNENEGWPGFTITQVHDKAKTQYPVRPNLVLINAGTNDCNRNQQDAIAKGAQRMENMVRDIFNNIPGATVILSGLLPNKNRDKCTKSLNDQYGQIVERLARDGENIVFANTYGHFTLGDLADGTHPTDAGYVKLAGIWWEAVRVAIQRDFISEPHDWRGPGGDDTKVV